MLRDFLLKNAFFFVIVFLYELRRYLFDCKQLLLLNCVNITGETLRINFKEQSLVYFPVTAQSVVLRAIKLCYVTMSKNA